jgi:plastocyanin
MDRFGYRRVALRRSGLLILLVAFGCLLPTTASARILHRTYRLGPVALSPYQSKIRYGRVAAPRVDGFITRMHARVVDGRGRFVPQQKIMLHHIVFKNLARRQPYCGGETTESFYGTGEENETLRLPPGYGYRVRDTDRWGSGWMLMNHRWKARRVYIEWKLTIDTAKRVTPVDPYWVNVACNRDPIFNVPGGGAPGSTYRRSVDWTVPHDGRIVATGGHFHGGGKDLRLTQPACGGRVLAQSVPQYGLASDPIYHVLPHVHEPGPRFTSWMTTADGIPVRRGEHLRLDSLYDAQHLHARVMGIMHVYVARGPAPTPACPALPSDEKTITWHHPYRGADDPPFTFIGLTEWGRNGRAVRVPSLPGRTEVVGGDTDVTVAHYAFSRRKVSVPLGSRVRWRFADPDRHDVTVANGPEGFASQPYEGHGRFSWRFRVPGTYQLHCSLHPVDMNEQIVVRP